MSLEFTTAKKRREPIHFVLDGEEYDFTPPKSGRIAVAAMRGDEPGMIRETFDWLSSGLPEEQVARIIAKLQDLADDFDMDDLGEIIQALQAEVAGRPTSSPNGSSPSPTPTGRTSTAGPRRKTSTR